MFRKLFAAGVLLLLFAGQAAGLTDIRWEYVNNMLPPARGFHASAELNGLIHIFGGWDGGAYLNLSASYDDPYNNWEPKAAITTPRKGLAGVMLNGALYAIGGANSMGETIVVEKYVPDYWTTEMSMMQARSELAAVAVNGRIYAIGGLMETGPVFYGTVEEYDPGCPCWTYRNYMNEPRAGMAAAAVGGRIYAIGGRSYGTTLGTVEEYDPVSDTWAFRAEMPTPRKWFAAVAINGRIYAIGGMDGAGQPLAVVEEYDPGNNIWKRLPDMPDARYGHAAAAVDGRIVVSGGFTFGGAVLDTVLRGVTISWNLPGKGKVIVAPNRLDPTSPDPFVKFIIQGNSFGTTGFRVYNELGQLMIERTGIALDQDGLAAVEYDGKDERGRKLGTGLYWVMFKDGGVEGKQAFMVARGEKR